MVPTKLKMHDPNHNSIQPFVTCHKHECVIWDYQVAVFCLTGGHHKTDVIKGSLVKWKENPFLRFFAMPCHFLGWILRAVAQVPFNKMEIVAGVPAASE